MEPDEDATVCEETGEEKAPEDVNVTLEVQSSRHFPVSEVKP